MSAFPRSAEEARVLLSNVRTRVDNLFDDVVEMETVQVEHTQKIAELKAENERLRQELEATKVIAEQAMVVAIRGHDPDSKSKIEVAKDLTRNELVRRAASGAPAQDRPLTISDVQTRAEPERVLMADGPGCVRRPRGRVAAVP